MKHYRIALCCVLGCALLLPFFATQPVHAVEPAVAFLKGLRERGYADMALEYLDRMETSPLCPPELKRNLKFERGVTLVLAGRLERDPSKQEAFLNQAQVALNDFVTRNPKDPNLEIAILQLGNVLLERARSKKEQADRPKNAEKREQLLQQARTFYDQAYDVFQKRLAAIKRDLLDPKYKNVDPEKDSETAGKRDALRGAYVQAQLMGGIILRMKAETYQKGSDEYKQGLQVAAEVYEVVYKKYRQKLAGLHARMYQARCLQQIGGEENHTDAVTFYGELLEQPFKGDALRKLRTKVIGMALECWLEAPKKKLDEPNYFQPAIEVSTLWLREARPRTDDQDQDWLTLRYWLAKTYKEAADRLGDKPKSKNAYVKEATGLARHVAKFPGTHKKDAQALLQELMGEGGGPDKVVKIEPQDFEEARSVGRDALDEVQFLRAGGAKVEGQLKQAKDDQKAPLEKQLAQLKESLAEQQENAVNYFRQALAFADEEVSINDKNIIHYFLCYLYYLDGSYYNAAVTGEFLAKHFPASTGARPCAKIAMASYLKLYKANPTEDRDFEIRRTVGVADYIVRKWPTQPESQEALSTLIPFMIKLGRLDEAQEYLEKIDPATPRRGEAELQTGQAMWARYLSGMNAIRNADKEAAAGNPPDRSNLPSQDDLAQLRERTQKTLANGIERMRQAAVDSTLAMAALSLAQVYVDTQQPQKAVELIEDENIGPKTLVETESPAVTQEAYKIEAYKVALRAYIGALPDVTGPAENEALMAKADGVMDALKQLMGGTSAGQERLIRIYISLARDIEEQIGNSPVDKRPALINGFEVFLTRVGEATKDIKELFWVAQTFYSLGQSSDSGADLLSPQAEGFYVKAIKAYENILEIGKTDKEAVTSDMVMQVKMRLATTKRRLGDFAVSADRRGKPGVSGGSIDLFEDILLTRNMMLNVQVEATMSYQEWARTTSADPKAATARYERAILGGRTNKKTNKYTIWGWGEISKKTIPDRDEEGKYTKTFFEARHNLDYCRYCQGKLQAGKQEREKYFRLCKNDIIRTYHLYPDLGGDESKAKLDKLLKLVQKELGAKPEGLAGIKEIKRGPDLLKALDEPKEEEEKKKEPEKE
jgi:hypothetical protein